MKGRKKIDHPTRAAHGGRSTLQFKYKESGREKQGFSSDFGNFVRYVNTLCQHIYVNSRQVRQFMSAALVKI
ncbi:MAG: hypothetical protein E7440_02885 [Ruminococcaceae bacterium]|nr:hypothetical protein [Oscillospiraceae bacterium]